MKPYHCMKIFSDAFEFCMLEDVEGYPYTWSNGHGMENNISQRLNRVVAYESLHVIFSYLKASRGNHFNSDHRAIIMQMETNIEDARNRKNTIFQWEDHWSKDLVDEKRVRNIWKQGIGMKDNIKAVEKEF